MDIQKIKSMLAPGVELSDTIAVKVGRNFVKATLTGVSLNPENGDAELTYEAESKPRKPREAKPATAPKARVASR